MSVVSVGGEALDLLSGWAGAPAGDGQPSRRARWEMVLTAMPNCLPRAAKVAPSERRRRASAHCSGVSRDLNMTGDFGSGRGGVPDSLGESLGFRDDGW